MMKDSDNNPPGRSRSEQLDIWSRTLIALVLGVLFGAIVTLVGLPAVEENLSNLIIGFVAIILITAMLAFWVVFNKERVLRRLFGVRKADLHELNQTSRELLSSMTARDWDTSKDHLEQLLRRASAWYSWVNFRRWVVMVLQSLLVGFGGLLGTMLLYNQNKLLMQQNALMTQQNKRLDQQTYLQEAERRSSLIFLMGNILDAVNVELRSDMGLSGVRDLSPQLVGRIIALSNSLRPYKYLENDSLISRELSPERGHLLLSIISSEIDRGTLRRIYRVADFSSADLKSAVLSSEYLAGINLANADLRGATLDEADFSDANLSGAELNGAVMSFANLRGSRFRQAKMRGVYLVSADLSQANFANADLYGANLTGANLRNAHFSNANLQKTNLAGADLRRVALRQAVLDSVIVSEFNWLDNLSTLDKDSIRGTNYLKTNYFVDSVQTQLGYFYMLLKRKEARTQK